MKIKRCSLRLRLLRMLLLPLIGAFFLIGLASYFSSYHEAEEIYDAQLTHFSEVLLDLTRHDAGRSDASPRRIEVDETLALHEYQKNFAYRVWRDGRLILYSSNSDAFGPPTQADGFAERMIEEKHWRFFVLQDVDVMVEVAERYEVREDMITHILGGIFLPQLVIIPLLGMVIWFGVAQGIRPLNTLSSIIRKRDPNNLEPLVAPVIPEEVTPVLEAINDLMQRTANVLEHEKQFSNYAAHELRTPLAALKTQLQVALRTKDQEKSRQLFAEMLPVTERMQLLVEQLLTFVRMQRSDSMFETVDLSGLCEGVLREMAGRAVATGRVLECDIAPGIHLHGNRDMLWALVRNLLDNALKYTMEGGLICLSLQTVEGGIDLKIKDNGIGVKNENQNQLFDCFYRAAGYYAEGSGLGLAIVKWVADAHHAAITITNGIGEKGVGFDVTFPVPEKHGA